MRDDWTLHLKDPRHERSYCGKPRVDYAEPEGVTCRSCQARLTFFRGVRATLIERGAWALAPGTFALDTRCGRLVIHTGTALYGWVACRFTDPERTNSKPIIGAKGLWNHHYGVSVDFDPAECVARFARNLDQLQPIDGWEPSTGVC